MHIVSPAHLFTQSLKERFVSAYEETFCHPLRCWVCGETVHIRAALVVITLPVPVWTCARLEEPLVTDRLDLEKYISLSMILK